MKVGTVIGTAGTPAIVHLGLAARQRHWPDAPCLVHDDHSDAAAALATLCGQYGADLESTAWPAGPLQGDNLAILAGLEWAEALELDYLVKFSRRYIPLFDWRPSLAEAVERGGEPGKMYGNKIPQSITGPMRSEAVAFDVRKWNETGLTHQFRQIAETTGDQTEFLLWRLSPLVRWDAVAAHHWSDDAYPTLWHFYPQADYVAAAQSFGLPYTWQDFPRYI